MVVGPARFLLAASSLFPIEHITPTNSMDTKPSRSPRGLGVAAAAGLATLLASCAPAPPVAGPVITQLPPPGISQAQQQAAAAAEERAKRRADARKAEAERKKRLVQQRARERKKKRDEARTTHKPPAHRPPAPKPTPKPDKPKYPTAKAVTGKPGFVFNPYTYDEVDVRGVPSGSVVRDPSDPNRDKNLFYVR